MHLITTYASDYNSSSHVQEAFQCFKTISKFTFTSWYQSCAQILQAHVINSLHPSPCIPFAYLLIWSLPYLSFTVHYLYFIILCSILCLLHHKFVFHCFFFAFYLLHVSLHATNQFLHDICFLVGLRNVQQGNLWQWIGKLNWRTNAMILHNMNLTYFDIVNT